MSSIYIPEIDSWMFPNGYIMPGYEARYLSDEAVNHPFWARAVFSNLTQQEDI